MKGEQIKRGRRPIAADVVDVRVNDEAVARAGAAATELVLHEEAVAENVRLVAKRLHYTGPLQPDLLEMGIRDEQQRGVHAVLAIGAMLTLLKEQCPHGEFTERVKRLGIEESLARRFMQTSLKFSDAEPKVLEAIGSQSKAFELLVLDDEEIEAFKTGESVRGLTLDKYATLTVSEARRTLRDQESTLKAKDKLIREKNSKIDELSEALHRLTSAEPDELERQQLDLLAEVMKHADLALVSALATAAGVMDKRATELVDLQARQSVEALMRRLVDACMKYGFGIDMAAEVDPFWVLEMKRAAAEGLDIEAQKRAARKALGRETQSPAQD